MSDHIGWLDPDMNFHPLEPRFDMHDQFAAELLGMDDPYDPDFTDAVITQLYAKGWIRQAGKKDYELNVKYEPLLLDYIRMKYPGVEAANLDLHGRVPHRVEPVTVRLHESRNVRAGWIAPDDTFYPLDSDRQSHDSWARVHPELLAAYQTPPLTPGDVIMRHMCMHGWIRKADWNMYELRRKDLSRAKDYFITNYPGKSSFYVDPYSDEGRPERPYELHVNEATRFLAARLFLEDLHVRPAADRRQGRE